MKWMKHMTASWDDERLAVLVGKGGMEGAAMYGLYWRVNEIIASQIEGKEPACSVRYSVTRWSLLLSLRGSLVFSTLSRLGVTGVVTVERDGDDIRVTNRNLLKYRDEYARKSGQTPDNVPARTDTEEEADTEEETESTFARRSDERSADVPPIGTLPCVGKKKVWPLYQAKVDEWQQTYPGVSVIAELRLARQWLIDNPPKRKTYGGMPRFLNTWLSKAQDAGGGTGNGKYQQHSASPAKTRVTSSYDTLDREAKRKGWSTLDDPFAADGPEVPAPGPVGVDGGAAARFRGAGDEVRPAPGEGRAGGSANPSGPEILPPTGPSGRGV